MEKQEKKTAKPKKLSFSEFIATAGIVNLTMKEKKSRYQKYIR